MYKHILIPTDGSDISDKGVRYGLDLAKSLGANVTIVTVTPMWPPVEMALAARHGNFTAAEDYQRLTGESANEILSAAAKTAEALGVTAKVLHVQNSHPAEGVLSAAADNGADLIVMASHGRRGLNRVLLGSIASEVVTQSTIPTLIVR